MKFLTVILLFTLLCIVSQSRAQCISNDPNAPCCNGLISTDPANPINHERPSLKNYFNWMDNPIRVYHPTPNGGYTSFNGGPHEMRNPFYTTESYLAHLNYRTFSFADHVPANLDFHPEDGWELLHKGNGFALNEIDLLPTAENRRGPYFILYNRYTGTLRTFAAFDDISTSETMQTILTLDGEANNTSRYFSGLLNRYEDIINPLDQEIEVVEVAQGSDYTGGGDFFSADFKMAYDPCICNYSSRLLFEFKTKETGQVKLGGRLIGTSVPLDGTGNSPLLNEREFLNTVHLDDNFDVQGGMLTYNNIDDLVEKYQQPEQSLVEKLAIAAIKSLISNVAKPFDQFLDKPAGTLFTKHVSGTPIPFSGGKTVDSLEKISLGIVGATTKQLSSSIGKGKKIPNISFVEAEMALAGEVRYDRGLGTGSVLIATPGSKGTLNTSQVPDRYYPAYNEALGVFALLETPVLKRKYSTHTSTDLFCPGEGGSTSVGIDNRTNYNLTPNQFKFYFNPAAEVNIEKTKIFGAIVLESTSSVNINKYKNLVKVPSLEPSEVASAEVPLEAKHIYISDFVPLESIHRLVPSLSDLECDITEEFVEGVSAYLRLQIFYEFKPNRYGKINQHWEILTYPLNIENGDFDVNSSLPEFPETLQVSDEYYNYEELTTVTALNTITITGNVKTQEPWYPPGEDVIEQPHGVTFVSEEIIIKSPSSIQSNATFTADVDNFYGDEKIAPVSAGYVKSFCNNTNRYKAKNSQVATRYRPEKENTTEALTNDEVGNISIFPNPVEDILTIQPQNIALPYQLRIYDFSGRMLNQQQIGTTQTQIDLSGYPTGLYIFEAIAADGERWVEKILKE